MSSQFFVHKVHLHATTSSDFAAFSCSQSVGVQNINISADLTAIIKSVAILCFRIVESERGDGPYAFMLSRQENAVFGGEIEFVGLDTQSPNAVVQGLIQCLSGVKAHLSAYTILKQVGNPGSAFHLVGDIVVPSVHQVYLVVSGYIQKAVLIHIHLCKLSFTVG